MLFMIACYIVGVGTVGNIVETKGGIK